MNIDDLHKRDYDPIYPDSVMFWLRVKKAFRWLREKIIKKK